MGGAPVVRKVRNWWGKPDPTGESLFGFEADIFLVGAVEAEDGDDVAFGGALAGLFEAEADVALLEVAVARTPIDADGLAAVDGREALENPLHGGAGVAFVLVLLI